MKVEARCENQGCATFGTMQLVPCAKLGSKLKVALDENGDMIHCPFCGETLWTVRVSNDSAQFPLGRTRITKLAKMLLAQGGLSEDPLAHAKMAAEFVACHVMGEPSKAVTYQFGDAVELDEGSIVTQHVYGGEFVWVVTNKERTETIVMLAREYIAA